MKRRALIKSALSTLPALAVTNAFGKTGGLLSDIAGLESIATGPFKPNWDSLQNYKVPEWYRDAKFGIWAHWGPQCQPEHGDWYARLMYTEGSDDYNYHVEKYGHPSKFGFKDVINEWKAENWDPEHLVNLYKNAGAKYFFAMANHHDNFDNYNSRYQRWNSTNMGPRKDIIGGWAKAAKNNDLQFGVSVHAAHAWMFYETAQGADKNGPLAGVTYDGNITKSNGKNTWWTGYDPQDLYAQRHTPGLNGGDQWDWTHGASIPDEKYFEKFFNRTVDLINKYNPDIVYFDDTVLPLNAISNVGLQLAAHLYNSNIKRHNGKLEAVLTGKILNDQQRKCMVWDIERRQSNTIQPLPWQTDTCLGNWHYDRRLFDNKGYKSVKIVIHTLVDVVSKNGNLLLNVPVRGDGTIDSEELAIVQGISAWNKINGECIFGTRPWVIYGEGPSADIADNANQQIFMEGKNKPFSGSDYRFTTKGKLLYAIVLGLPPEGKATLKSLKLNSAHYPGGISSVRLLGTDQQLYFERNADALTIQLPDNLQEQVAYSFKIFPA
jgi:alpha-L-fucosidase